MPNFTVRHNYRSFRDGQQFGPWVEGDQVQLTEADAEWLERDSPGLLVAAAKPKAEPEPAPKPAGAKPPAADRQARPARNRSGT
jgi:hypothetical protein